MGTGYRHAQTLTVPVGPFGASVDPRGTRCAYICEFSINWPVACCLFLSLLERTLDTYFVSPPTSPQLWHTLAPLAPAPSRLYVTLVNVSSSIAILDDS